MNAISAEIAKFKSFNAFEEVPDEGQKCIPTKWVVTKQQGNGKNQPIKARLCMRGDLERGKENLRADAPTASKEALKIALMIAANENFKVKAGDIKSAFLQGEKLDRTLYVKPPKEAGTDKLWKLVQGAYGILDGSRLFFMRLARELIELGMHQIHSDNALFSYVKNGKLHGIIVTNTDDLILAGDDVFDKDITTKLLQIFKFSKLEEDSFTYCGCDIKINSDGTIELDQNNYIRKIEEIDDTEAMHNRKLTDKEIKKVKAKLGELLWVSLITRPDLSFDVNSLSSKVLNGSTDLLKTVNCIIRKAKSSKNVLRFVRLGDISKLSVIVYADASFCNQDGSTRSTEGRVVMLCNKETGHLNIGSWKTKKIVRVCRSAKAAETRALEEAVDDGINVARIIREIYSGEVNLKAPEQIPVQAYTDSKSLWESIHNSRQCDEKLLRNSIAAIKELIDLKMLTDVSWVSTDFQLADCLTKKGKKADWLLRTARTNHLGLNN